MGKRPWQRCCSRFPMPIETPTLVCGYAYSDDPSGRFHERDHLEWLSPDFRWYDILVS